LVGSPKISQVDTEINSYSVVVSSAGVFSLSAGTFSTFSLSLKKFLNPYEKKKADKGDTSVKGHNQLC